MSKKDKLTAVIRIKDALSDIESAVWGAERHLEEFDDDDFIDVPDSVRESIAFGLQFIEAKYGLSSKEAQDVRKFLAKADE